MVSGARMRGALGCGALGMRAGLGCLRVTPNPRYPESAPVNVVLDRRAPRPLPPSGVKLDAFAGRPGVMAAVSVRCLIMPLVLSEQLSPVLNHPGLSGCSRLPRYHPGRAAYAPPVFAGLVGLWYQPA